MNDHNVLTDRILPINQNEWLSLPEVLTSLAQEDRIATFLGLQPYQWPAWYQFLVQLAALCVLDRAEEWRAFNPLAWQSALRNLTPTYPGDEPWCLVVEDLAHPALLQPPVPEKTLSDFKGPIYSPADTNLDLLVTSRHHDLKVDRVVSPKPHHWVFTLVTLQTQAGYSGLNFKHGVVRMNGGYGSRPLVGIAPGRGWGERFRRDLTVLLREHDNIAEDHQRPRRGSTGLTWLEPWNGTNQIPLANCSPYFIEICRRVRLMTVADQIVAYRTDTKVPRISPKSDVLKGNVGDPWIPINASNGAALSVGGAGFSYDRTRQLLLEDGFKGGKCQQIQPDDPPDLWLCCAALARGQGGTEGFHERWIPIPARARSFLLDPDARRTLGVLAKERVERTGKVWDSALFPALQILLKGGVHQEKKQKPLKMPERWRWIFNSEVDACYFPRLWEDLDLEPYEQQRRWTKALLPLARETLRQAEREAPIPDIRRERAISAAWALLESGLRKNIPEAFDTMPSIPDPEENTHASPTLP